MTLGYLDENTATHYDTRITTRAEAVQVALSGLKRKRVENLRHYLQFNQ